LKAELSEGSDQVRWLQERMDEIEVQKREAKNTINTAERVLRMKETSTRSEVFRLKGDHPPLIYLCII
jgi:kinetochore protein Spc7/SPC105